MVQPLWKTVWNFLKSLNSYHLTQQFYWLVCSQEKWNPTYTKMCTSVLLEIFIIAKKWKQPKCPSINEWVNKIQYIHTIAIKWKYWKMLHRQMNLKNITLSERSQLQKVKYCMIPFIWNVQKRQIYRDRK